MTQRRLHTYLESAAAGLLLVALLPLLIVVAVAITLDSGGPVLVRRQTCSKRGERMNRLTFRTTHPTSDSFTRVGWLLHRTGLESLPALWNVLTGELRMTSVAGGHEHS